MERRSGTPSGMIFFCAVYEGGGGGGGDGCCCKGGIATEEVTYAAAAAAAAACALAPRLERTAGEGPALSGASCGRPSSAVADDDCHVASAFSAQHRGGAESVQIRPLAKNPSRRSRVLKDS